MHMKLSLSLNVELECFVTSSSSLLRYEEFRQRIINDGVSVGRLTSEAHRDVDDAQVHQSVLPYYIELLLACRVVGILLN